MVSNGQTNDMSTVTVNPAQGTHSWCSAYGVWHVRINRTITDTVQVARERLREEITQRSAHVADDVWRHPVQVHDLSDKTTVVYRERFLDEDPTPSSAQRLLAGEFFDESE